MSDPQETIAIPPVHNDLTGTTVGRFLIMGRIGAGGMGQVYRAEDTMLKRLVAIKRMAPQLQFEERDRDRFLKEAQRASALNHPNIAAIYDVLQEKGEILLVMEYVEGTTLRHRIKSPISIPEFLEIAIQCAEALDAAHDQRIVHKDIKPENIMLNAAHRVKVLDFGVSMRFVADASEATQSFVSMTASLSGTPGYMAPEVLQQRPYDGRADLFSLGLVFYEMLGGEHPFTTDSFAGTLARVLHREPPSLMEVNRTVPSQLSGIVECLLEKDPNQRYPSAQVLLADLMAVQAGGKPVFALSKPRHGARLRRLSTRWKATLIAVAALPLLLLAVLIFRDAIHRASTVGPRSNISGLPETKNLAILPLQVGDDDPKFAAFGNGLVETLTAKLNQLGENHSVQVVPAGELRSKHVTTLDQARQEFGVNLGLRIGLEQSGDLVRVHYTLIDSKSGLALSARSFDAPISDPFGIEDQVAGGVAGALGVELRPEERRELLSHGTSIPEAYNYYLQASGYLDDPSKPENVVSALTLLAHALKLDPNYGIARAGMGMAYWWKYSSTKNKDAVKLARDACAKAVESGRAAADGHVCLGIVENGTGGYEQAVTQFQKAVALEPTNDEAYSGLALAYQRLNKLDEAEKTYQRAIDLRPQHSRGYINLGGFYLQQQQYSRAVDMFSRAVALAPDSYWGYSDLGAAYLLQAKYADAIKPLEQSIAVRPTSFAFTNLGTAYLRLRRYPDAVRAYQETVKLDEGEYTGWGSFGDALYYNGDRSGAKKAYEKAIDLARKQLEVNPKDAEVLGDVADYYAMVGDRTHALELLDQSLRWGHGNKDLLLNAAVVYQDLGETGEALEWLKKALDAGLTAATASEMPSFDALKNDPRFEILVKGPSK